MRGHDGSECSRGLSLRAFLSKSGPAAANESAAGQGPSTDVQPHSLPVHDDIFTLIQAEKHAKKELKAIASRRPGTEHRVDQWADMMLGTTGAP